MSARRRLSELSDPQLVGLVQATGDADAYGELTRRHQAALRAFLWRLCGDRARADDLTQDALIRGYRALGGFQGGSAFRTWLFRIAWREFLQARRKSGLIARLLAGLERPDEAVTTGAEATLDLQRALATLDPHERAALLLCDACGMSNTEAAEAMDVPLGSLKTYIARGRARMRALLGAPAEGPDHGD